MYSEWAGLHGVFQLSMPEQWVWILNQKILHVMFDVNLNILVYLDSFLLSNLKEKEIYALKSSRGISIGLLEPHWS